jgi:iron-sulfur cluster repair protein YtfE (RIC family)
MQQRFNPFHQIHQALRALLYHTGITLQQTDFAVADQEQKTIALVQQVIAFFEAHAHTEDTLVFPLINDAAPALVADFEAQHVEDHRLGQELADALHAVAAAENAAAKTAAGYALQHAFRAFMAFNITHMAAEEQVVLPVIHQHHTDADLLQREAEIVASLSPEKLQFSAYWMLKGLNAAEIAQWYAKIRQHAPEPVFAEFMQLAETALPDDKLKQLQDALFAQA